MTTRTGPDGTTRDPATTETGMGDESNGTTMSTENRPTNATTDGGPTGGAVPGRATRPATANPLAAAERR